jgi:1-acyl-sn-glycerol-3-phosphate acyltransferase
VAISGSYDVFERTSRIQPGPVAVRFGAPIPTAGIPPEGRKNTLADQVHGVIKEALEL